MSSINIGKDVWANAVNVRDWVGMGEWFAQTPTQANSWLVPLKSNKTRASSVNISLPVIIFDWQAIHG